MRKKRNIANLPDFDLEKFLKDDEDIAAYLTVVIGENAPSLLAAALGGYRTGQRDDRISSIHRHNPQSLVESFH